MIEAVRDNDHEVRPGDRLVQFGEMGGPALPTRTFFVIEADDDVVVAYSAPDDGEGRGAIGDRIEFEPFDLKALREDLGWVVISSAHRADQAPRPYGVGGHA